MPTSAEKDCPSSGSGVSQDPKLIELEIRARFALRASEDSTRVLQSLIEGVSPVDPKYANICGSNKDPMSLWEGLFLGMYDAMTQEVLSDEPRKRPERPILDVPTPRKATEPRPLLKQAPTAPAPVKPAEKPAPTQAKPAQTTPKEPEKKGSPWATKWDGDSDATPRS